MLDNKNKANSMETSEPEPQQTAEDWEEVCEEDTKQEQENDQETEDEEHAITEEAAQQKRRQNKPKREPRTLQSRSSFVHGLATGLGIGCIAAFIMMWTAVFFTPRLSPGITYEAMLATFIYPLIYLLALGLIALTAGIAREYYAVKSKA